jgi:hypothetical protein
MAPGGNAPTKRLEPARRACTIQTTNRPAVSAVIRDGQGPTRTRHLDPPAGSCGRRPRPLPASPATRSRCGHRAGKCPISCKRPENQTDGRSPNVSRRRVAFNDNACTAICGDQPRPRRAVRHASSVPAVAMRDLGQATCGTDEGLRRRQTRSYGSRTGAQLRGRPSVVTASSTRTIRRGGVTPAHRHRLHDRRPLCYVRPGLWSRAAVGRERQPLRVLVAAFWRRRHHQRTGPVRRGPRATAIADHTRLRGCLSAGFFFTSAVQSDRAEPQAGPLRLRDSTRPVGRGSADLGRTIGTGGRIAEVVPRFRFFSAQLVRN